MTLADWHRKTNLVLSLNFGGCNPMAGGEIMVGQYIFRLHLSRRMLTKGCSFHLGRTEAGNTFDKAHPTYEETIQGPFSSFVRKVFRTSPLFYTLRNLTIT
jgi:hypothetical protein